MPLTQTQHAFLSKYTRIKDVDQVLNELELTFLHIAKWCQEPEFDLEYRRIKRFILQAQKEEAALLASEYVLNVLRDGCIKERTHSVKTIKNADGDIVSIASEMKVTEKSIPVPMLLQCLQTSGVVKAVEELSTQGVLSSEQYKALLAISEKMTLEMEKVLSGTDTDKSEISEAKAIQLIKQAVLGVLPTK